MSPSPKVVTQSELVGIVGRTKRTVQRWSEEVPPIPRMADGRYDLADVWQWALARERRAIESNGDAAALLSAQARKETALAEMREQQLAERRGELVTLDFMEAELETSLSAVADAIRSMPHRLAQRMAEARLLSSGSSRRCRRLIADHVEDELLPALQRLGDDEDPV